MNRKFAKLCGVVAALGLGVSAFAHNGEDHGNGAHKDSTEGKAVTVQGELIDTACFTTSDGDAKGRDHAACATKCLGSGVPAAVLPEGSKDADAMRFLLTNPTVLAQYAGQTIKVEGTEYADKHAIDVKKLSVKQGNDWKEVPLKDEHHKMTGGGAPASDGHTGHEHK
jgi:hypothetical protein